MMEIYEEGSFEGFYYAVMNDYLEEACAWPSQKILTLLF
jgi:hypothetical protein